MIDERDRAVRIVADLLRTNPMSLLSVLASQGLKLMDTATAWQATARHGQDCSRAHMLAIEACPECSLNGKASWEQWQREPYGFSLPVDDWAIVHGISNIDGSPRGRT